MSQPDPYAATLRPLSVPESDDRFDAGGNSRGRRIALVFLVLPFAVAPILWYWVFHMAGGWYVDLNLKPEHRAAHLFEMFLLDLTGVAGIAWFVALIALFLDGKRRGLIGCLLALITPVAFLGMVVLALTILSYFRFSARPRL